MLMIPCSENASVPYFLLKKEAVSVSYICLGSVCLFSKMVDKQKTFKPRFHQFPFSQAMWSPNRSVAYYFISDSVDENLSKFSRIQMVINTPRVDELLSSKCMTKEILLEMGYSTTMKLRTFSFSVIVGCDQGQDIETSQALA